LTGEVKARSIRDVGRIPGRTAEDTARRLVDAAAEVFARRGYEGTRVTDIAAAAGVSNGALYAHFGSKAELLVAALRTHGRRVLADLLAAEPDRAIAEVLLATGRTLPHQDDGRGALVTEALVAARRDPEVAALVRGWLAERAGWLAGLVRDAAGRGEVDPAVPPAAVAHLCLALAAGTALLGPDLTTVDDGEWGALLARLVGVLTPDPHPVPQPGGQRR
jgi:TetR/AcrR family transcriptional repressor of nem operon